VATRVKLIDEHGEPAGRWKEDEYHVSAQQIRSCLPKNNCIAHPSIMINTAVIRKYRYDQSQLHSEDYDLWLRLSADGIEIHKVNEQLLLHRIHTASVTRKDQDNVFLKLARVKLRFTKVEFKKGNYTGFVLKTFLLALTDWIKGIIKPVFSK
jgi:hypothetical protein